MAMSNFQIECTFYLYWICKFPLCNSLKYIFTSYFPIATTLAKGHKLALAPFMLAISNRCFYYMTFPHFYLYVNGPLGLLLLWIYAYFDSLAPVPCKY